MRAFKKITAVFLIVNCAVNLVGLKSYASASETAFKEAFRDFRKDTIRIEQYQNTGFWDRHKYKIIGGAAGLVVAGGIIVATWGAGTPAAPAAGAATAAGATKFCITLVGAGAGAGVAALVGGTIALTTAGGALMDWLTDEDIKLTPEIRLAIYRAIGANRDKIVKEANNKDQAIHMMKDLAIKAAKKYR